MDFVWVSGDDFVDEFRVECETFRKAELIYNQQQNRQREQMPQQNETKLKVKRWKIVIVGIGRIKRKRRRKLINENKLNLILPTLWFLFFPGLYFFYFINHFTLVKFKKTLVWSRFFLNFYQNWTIIKWTISTIMSLHSIATELF